LRARYGLGADPYDPHDNILAGAACIRELHDGYGSPSFRAAYNVEPRRYEHHLATGRPLADETQAYVATLASIIESKQTGGKIVAIVRSLRWIPLSLFVARTASNSSDDRLPHGVHPDRPPRTALLSIYRRCCRSQATCSYSVPARFDRNGSDRASSRCVGKHRIL
jgi:hypothetical protein